MIGRGRCLYVMTLMVKKKEDNERKKSKCDNLDDNEK